MFERHAEKREYARTTSCSNSFQLTWLWVAIRPARFYGYFSPGDKIKEIARKCLLCVGRAKWAGLRATLCDEQFANCRRELFTKLACFPFFAYRRRNLAQRLVSFNLCRITTPTEVYRLSQNERLERAMSASNVSDVLIEFPSSFRL